MSRHRRGVMHPASKLDERMAEAIYYAAESSYKIAEVYGVSSGLIRKLRRRGAWGRWRAPHGRAG